MRCFGKTLLVLEELHSDGFIPAPALSLFERELGEEVHQSSVYSGTYAIVDHHARIASERILRVHHEHAFIGIIKDESPTNYEEAMMGPKVPINSVVLYNPE